MTLDEINRMPRARFVESLGWIFEDSPWVAERAWHKRPFASRGALHAAMVSQIELAGPEQQLALLRAHPDLGARARMSGASVGEQAGAGLHELTAAEYEKLQRLNAAYRDKFGFPFLLAVKGNTKRAILEKLERRTASAPEEELREALRQTYRIALFRLDDTIEG